ncbi:MAG: outer membrane protein transport protein [Pseudomonadota bacterium]
MKNVLLATTAMTALAGAATAGGLERTPQSMAILFEEGRYFELSFGVVAPDVSGTLGGAPSGDMLSTYANLGVSYKADLNDRLSYAIIFDQPYGADTEYPTGTTHPFAGSTAEVNSNAISTVLQYNFDNGASVYGGPRFQTLQAEAFLPPLGGYTVESDTNFALGYLVGAAYERPDIALRVALTYHSKTTHDLELSENGAAPTTQDVELPQALNLEFQSGVAEDTLVFGSVRWVEWSATAIDPPVYDTITVTAPPLVFFTDDRVTYTLGVGRRLNDTWSVLGSVSYEETTGGVTGNLGPTDGFTSVSLGAIYRKDNMKITGGVRYADIGDATSFTPAFFEDNDAIAAGLRVGWSF